MKMITYTEGSLNIYIKLNSYDNIILNYTSKLILKILKEIIHEEKITIIGMPTTIKKYTLLKSPHVDKKSRDQWEIRTLHRIIILHNIPNITSILPILNFIKLYIPGGVGILISLHSQLKLIDPSN